MSIGGSVPSGRCGHSSTVLADGSILVFGGSAKGRVNDTFIINISIDIPSKDSMVADSAPVSMPVPVKSRGRAKRV